MTDHTPAPRPVPAFADRTATDAPLPTWLPDALDELREVPSELERLRTALDRTNTDRKRLQAEIDGTDTAVVDTVRRLHRTEAERDEALAERDEAREQLVAGVKARTTVLTDEIGRWKAKLTEARADRDDARRERDDYREARDVARQTADFYQGVNDRHRQELGAAGDVLAVVRDAVERIDRALATYDTTPVEEPPSSVPSRRAQEATETDVPDWVLELIRGLAKYEAEHPKLFRYAGGDAWCPCSLLEGVPKAIREQARP